MGCLLYFAIKRRGYRLPRFCRILLFSCWTTAVGDFNLYSDNSSTASRRRVREAPQMVSSPSEPDEVRQLNSSVKHDDERNLIPGVGVFPSHSISNLKPSPLPWQCAGVRTSGSQYSPCPVLRRRCLLFLYVGFFAVIGMVTVQPRESGAA